MTATPIQLPESYVISESFRSNGSRDPVLQQPATRKWISRFRHHIQRGTRLLQIRLKDLDSQSLISILSECRSIAAHSGTRLILNGPSELARDLGLGGVHLTSQILNQIDHRPLPGSYLVGASCHSLEELRRAEMNGCDFACLSPVRHTKEYEHDEVLGLDKFAAMIREFSIPVYALGGMAQGDLDSVRAVGGQGVSGISSFW